MAAPPPPRPAIALTVAWAAWASVGLAESDDPSRTLATILDFRQQPAAEMAPFAAWHWTAAQKAQAPTLSPRAIVRNPDGEGQVLRIEVAPEFPWRKGPESTLILTRGQFPPESDLVVLRLRVESGAFTVAIGGPTAYFGDSDVITAPQRIEAGGWQSVRCDLYAGLCRNYRRAGYGREAKTISYNRWAQEPPSLYLLPGSTGVLLLESVSLIATGRGQPFPSFGAAELTSVRTVPLSLDHAFTALMADSQTADFERSWREPSACRYAPPRLAATAGPTATALSSTTAWAEEIRWAGVNVEPTPNANALVVTVRVNSPLPATQFASDAGQPIDFGLLYGASGSPFPWQRLGPPDEWRQGAAARGYDLNLSNRVLLQERDLHVALYQARRFVKVGEWQTLTLPFDDFVCIAATGKFQPRLVARGSPDADALSGIAWLLPWPRSGKTQEASLEVADLQLATISADSRTPRRSYPAPVTATLEPLAELTDYGGWVRSTPTP